MSLSYDKLARISRGLEIDIGLLFTSETVAPLSLVTGRRSITRAGEGRLIQSASGPLLAHGPVRGPTRK